jgi:hypothetical protein
MDPNDRAFFRAGTRSYSEQMPCGLAAHGGRLVDGPRAAGAAASATPGLGRPGYPVRLDAGPRRRRKTADGGDLPHVSFLALFARPRGGLARCGRRPHLRYWLARHENVGMRFACPYRAGAATARSCRRSARRPAMRRRSTTRGPARPLTLDDSGRRQDRRRQERHGNAGPHCLPWRLDAAICYAPRDLLSHVACPPWWAAPTPPAPWGRILLVPRWELRACRWMPTLRLVAPDHGLRFDLRTEDLATNWLHACGLGNHGHSRDAIRRDCLCRNTPQPSCTSSDSRSLALRYVRKLLCSGMLARLWRLRISAPASASAPVPALRRPPAGNSHAAAFPLPPTGFTFPDSWHSGLLSRRIASPAPFPRVGPPLN